MQQTVLTSLLITGEQRLRALTIGPQGRLEAPPGQRVLMTVDHVLTDPVPGSYEGEIILTPVDDQPELGAWKNDYRSALLVTDRGVQVGACAAAAVTGRLRGETLTGGSIRTRGNCLNGLTISGGVFRAEGTEFSMQGNGGDDFELWGSAVAACGNANLVLDGVSIRTKGAIATAVAAGGDSRVVVMHSMIRGEGTDNTDWHAKHPHLSETPWVLGLRGTQRSTNVLDNANVTYYDCDCSCNGWGVLSVDGTKQAVHNIINTRAEIPAGQGYGSGYGAYILGGVTSTFLGVRMDVPDYCFAVGGNNCPVTVGSSSQENLLAAGDHLAPLAAALSGGLAEIPARGSVLRSARFIGMWHHQSTAPFVFLPGTELYAGDTAFLIKSGAARPNGPEISCTDVQITAPRLIHLMETDDAGMGTRTHDGCWAPCIEVYPEEFGSTDGFDPTVAGENAAVLTLCHMTLCGDSYNTRRSSGQALVLKLEDTRLTGIISTGVARHRCFSYGLIKNADGSRSCTDEKGRKYKTERLDDLLFGKMPVTNYVPQTDEAGRFVYDETDTACHPTDGYGLYYTQPQKIADMQITACATPTAALIVELRAGSVWTVAGESHLTCLHIDEGCQVCAEPGRTLIATCNGEPITLGPGIYRGLLVLRVQ